MPTFQNMRLGSAFPGINGIPGKRFGAPRPNFANQPYVTAKAFRSKTGAKNLTMTGVSRDSAGAILGNCRVMIFTTGDNLFVMETTSDGSGNWSVTLNKSGPFFLVEYKAGAPDLAGTSVNTLVPV